MSSDDFVRVMERRDGSWHVEYGCASVDTFITDVIPNVYDTRQEAIDAGAAYETEYGVQVFPYARRARTGLFASLEECGFTEEFADQFYADFPADNLFPSVNIVVLSATLTTGKKAFWLVIRSEKDGFESVSRSELILLPQYPEGAAAALLVALEDPHHGVRLLSAEQEYMYAHYTKRFAWLS